MSKILLDVKPFQETLNADMCGPASLKIVSEYYGINKSEDELSQLCKFKERLGADDKGIRTGLPEARQTTATQAQPMAIILWLWVWMIILSTCRIPNWEL